MEEFEKLAKGLKEFAEELDRQATQFIQSLPIHTHNEFKRLSTRELQSTQQAYIDAVNSEVIDDVLLVELDRDNWLANAVEDGVGQFDMKEGLLSGKSAKVGKDGFRYARVPVNGNPQVSKGTDKGKAMQNRIKEVLSQKNFGLSKLKTDMSGGVVESQQVQGMSGLYRTRKHQSSEAYHSGRSRPKWEYVLFRTVSEHPNAKSKWQHPGIKPVKFFPRVERWLNDFVEQSLNQMMDDLDKKFSL